METNNNEKNKIIGSCNTCRTPIYENEAVYDFTVDRSSNQSSNYKDGNPAPNDQIIETTGHSENWKQCAWCYDQGQTELAGKEPWIGRKRLWLSSLSNVIITVLFIYLLGNNSADPKKIIFIPLVVFLLILTGSWTVKKIFCPEPVVPDRYRIRVRHGY